MRFKGERVWVRADESGRPVLDADGRAEMKYRESDAKSYRPSLGNLLPDQGGPSGPSGDPPPARKRPHADGPKRHPDGPKPHPDGHRPHADGHKKKEPSPGGAAIEIWTDGACSGNPGPMGIGVVIIDGPQRREKGEYLGVGTNNIAELTAIERGIDLSGGADRRLRVYTDSSYAIGVLSKGWKAKANQELIARLRRRLAPLDVEFVKVSGHAGVPENERCDELARDAITGRSR
jgi:ribonuclease HI